MFPFRISWYIGTLDFKRTLSCVIIISKRVLLIFGTKKTQDWDWLICFQILKSRHGFMVNRYCAIRPLAKINRVNCSKCLAWIKLSLKSTMLPNHEFASLFNFEMATQTMLIFVSVEKKRSWIFFCYIYDITQFISSQLNDQHQEYSSYILKKYAF